MDYRIMVAEDEPKLREVVCDYLLSRGDVPVPAGDGLEALALAEEDGNFDAVVLDVMMPGLDGFAVCRALRRRSAVPILFLTALSDEEDKLWGYELGADDYITKPFSLSLLYAKVTALIRRDRGGVLTGDTLRCGGPGGIPLLPPGYGPGGRGALPHPQGVRPPHLPHAEPEHGHEPGAAAGEVLGLRLRGGVPGGGHPHPPSAGEAGPLWDLHQDRHQGGV